MGTARPEPCRRPPGPRPGPASWAARLRASRSSVPVPGLAVPMAPPACSPLPPHVSGAGAGDDCWLQDLRAAAPAARDPSIQTREAARPAPVPAQSTPSRLERGVRGASGPPGALAASSGSSGSDARLSAGERRGLGLCLLRERQPRGGAEAGASPPPPRLRRTELVPRTRSGRAWGRELSPPGPVNRTYCGPQPRGLTPGFVSLLIPRGSLYILGAVSLVLHMAGHCIDRWIFVCALY